MNQNTKEIYKHVKLHIFRKKKNAHLAFTPLLVTGLTGQLFHFNCISEVTELRTDLRPQTQMLHTKPYDKALLEVRYVTGYPINIQCFKEPAYGNVKCRETGGGHDRDEGWTVNLIKCFSCGHKGRHASSTDGDVLKVRSWSLIP